MRETGDPTRETDTAAEVPRARATTVHIFWSREADAMGSTKNDQLFYTKRQGHLAFASLREVY